MPSESSYEYTPVLTDRWQEEARREDMPPHLLRVFYSEHRLDNIAVTRGEHRPAHLPAHPSSRARGRAGLVYDTCNTARSSRLAGTMLVEVSPMEDIRRAVGLVMRGPDFLHDDAMAEYMTAVHLLTDRVNRSIQEAWAVLAEDPPQDFRRVSSKSIVEDEVMME